MNKQSQPQMLWIIPGGMSPKPSVYFNRLKGLAHEDWVASKILWKLGIYLPSIFLLLKSLEKYLKCLWVNENISRLKQENRDVDKELRNKFSHRIDEIIDEIDDKKYKDKIVKHYNKNRNSIYKLDVLSYSIFEQTKDGLKGVKFDDNDFEQIETFIFLLRNLLDDKIDDSFIEEFKKSSKKMIIVNNPLENEVKNIMEL